MLFRSIHWAWGAASVDQHGMPRPTRMKTYPSEIGTSTLLDPEILETILTRQYADHKWISRELIQGEGDTWRATFFRDRDNAQAMIRYLRKDTATDPWPVMSNILNIIQIFPSSPTILEEAMHALCMLTPPWRTGNDVLGWYLLGAETLANTLYSTLSRHALRSTPYSRSEERRVGKECRSRWSPYH